MAQLKDTQITGDLVVIKDGVEVNILDAINELRNTTAKSGGYIEIERGANVTNYSSDYNAFTPFSGSDINVTAQKGNLSLDSDVFNYSDRSNQTVYGIRVGAGISMVKVTSITTYVSEGSNTTVRNSITRYRPSDASKTTFGSYAYLFRGASTERHTYTHSAFMDVQEGDLIYVWAYKYASAGNIDVYADFHGTKLIVEVVE